VEYNVIYRIDIRGLGAVTVELSELRKASLRGEKALEKAKLELELFYFGTIRPAAAN
jgi:hypothetical protein